MDSPPKVKRVASSSTPLLLADEGHAIPSDATGSDGATPRYGPVWQRWYILGVFFVLSATQSITWNFYGPIAGTVERADVLGWSRALLRWIPNTANLSMVLCVYPSAVAAARGGIRGPTIACAACLLAQVALRVVVPTRAGEACVAANVAAMARRDSADHFCRLETPCFTALA